MKQPKAKETPRHGERNRHSPFQVFPMSVPRNDKVSWLCHGPSPAPHLRPGWAFTSIPTHRVYLLHLFHECGEQRIHLANKPDPGTVSPEHLCCKLLVHTIRSPFFFCSQLSNQSLTLHFPIGWGQHHGLQGLLHTGSQAHTDVFGKTGI